MKITIRQRATCQGVLDDHYKGAISSEFGILILDLGHAPFIRINLVFISFGAAVHIVPIACWDYSSPSFVEAS